MSMKYILAIEEYVVRLHCRIDDLSEEQYNPYADPAFDFAMRFYDHPAYKDVHGILVSDEPE